MITGVVIQRPSSLFTGWLLNDSIVAVLCQTALGCRVARADVEITNSPGVSEMFQRSPTADVGRPASLRHWGLGQIIAGVTVRVQFGGSQQICECLVVVVR